MATSKIQAGRTLLWENPNVSLGKGAFTVTLPKAYGAYLVQYAIDTGNTSHVNSFVFAEGVNTTASTTSSGKVYSRSVSISGTTASFTAGWFDQNANSNAMIPVAIYGVGGVVSRLLKALKTLSFRKERGWV